MLRMFYDFSLCATAVLSLFTGIGYIFGCWFSRRQTLNATYIQSRYWMAGAMWLLFTLSVLHLVFHIREKDNFTGAAVTLCFFYIVNQLYELADLSLTHVTPVSKRRIILTLLTSATYATVLGLAYHFASDSVFRMITMVCCLVYFVDSIYLSYEFYRNYKHITLNLSNFYADDYEAYLRWMPRCRFMLTAINILSPIVVFFSLELMAFFNALISLVLFYVFVCYERYIIFEKYCSEAVKMAEEDKDAEISKEMKTEERIRAAFSQWIEGKGYCQPNINIIDVCKAIGTNRTYLSKYINTHYNQTFRGLIAELRINDAKRLLATSELSLVEIALQLGFPSQPAFSRIFIQQVGDKPSNYRKMVYLEKNTRRKDTGNNVETNYPTNGSVEAQPLSDNSEKDAIEGNTLQTKLPIAE